MKLLPMPMFGRIFIALLVMTISALVLIAATFGNYQDRVIAMTLAPMRAAAIRTDQEQPGPSQRALDLRMRVDVFGGSPPAQAYSIASDGRTKALWCDARYCAQTANRCRRRGASRVRS